MNEISAAITGMNGVLQLLGDAIAGRDEKKINAAISQLKDRLFDTQSANLELVQRLHAAQARIHALIEENAQLKAQIADRLLYRLHNLHKGEGFFFAYRYQPPGLNAQFGETPLHYLCQPCFDGGKKAVLFIDDRFARCPVCKTITPIVRLLAPQRQIISRGIRP